MAKEFTRSRRVSDQIQRELAGIIQLEMKDPRLGMVTVSGVDVTRDMSYAKVFVTFLGLDTQKEIDQALEILNEASGFLRSLLAKGIRMRATPQLRFQYDASLRRGRELSSLIDRAMEIEGDKKPAADEE
ncbi:30S ribosome-binding factor RbfA [Spongorhabdus nitratireducens]